MAALELTLTFKPGQLYAHGIAPVSSVASPLEVPRPTIFHVAYLNLMRVAGVVGLASIVDGLRIWRGFLREIVIQYQEWIRRPLFEAFMLVWPASWPMPPRIGVDVLIVWSAFFAAASYHVYFEDGRNIISHIYANESNMRRSRLTALLRTIAKVAFIFVFGPVLYPVMAIKHYRRGGRSDQLMVTRWLVMNPGKIVKYVAYQLLALVLLLFINYQLVSATAQ